MTTSHLRTTVIGVIGHVDHGKTALVGALTGIDTDRLAEEKRRGISIALGFAHRPAAAGTLAFIDMPGHERFVRTMIAGATGIDAALLVVAANEGIKPQTIEHLAIARLIGVQRGVVAITKCDLVSEAQAAATAQAVRQLLGSTPLQGMPVIHTSTATGEGLDRLSAALEELFAEDGGRQDLGCFHLPVDRAFAVPGFGPVVTGTLRRGSLQVGDTVELWPNGRTLRVRGLHAHGEPVDRAGPGSRVAVNLRDAELAELGRGGILATPGLLAPSRWIDIWLDLLPDAPRALKTGDTVQLLFGTTDVTARLRLLDRDLLEPGDAAPAQLACAELVTATAGEPYVLRQGSPAWTMAGGRILDPASVRRRRFDPAVIRATLALAEGRLPDAVVERLALAGDHGLRSAELARLYGLPPSRLEATLPGAVELPPDLWLAESLYRQLCDALMTAVQEFQAAIPTERGAPVDRLREALPPQLPPETLSALVAQLVAEGRLVRDAGLLRRSDLNAAALLSSGDRDTLAHVETAFRDGGLTPPDVAEVAGRDDRRHRALHYLARTGVLVRTIDRVQKREIVFHRDAVALAAERVAAALSGTADGLTLGELAKLLGITRKFGVPLLEHLDRIGVSRRHGDRRVLATLPARTADPQKIDGGGAPASTS
nr:selenocysteine-specific translation elongation factor [uncultured Azospirillum sp.]